MTAQAGSRIAQKGLFTAAKVLGLSAVRMMRKPDVIEKAKELVLRQNGGKYQCPLPDDVTPPVGKY
jgi:aminobenzoyl-glutamate utilization protein B